MNVKEEREIDATDIPIEGAENPIVIKRPRKEINHNKLLIAIAVMVGVVGVLGIAKLSGIIITIITIITWVLIFNLDKKTKNEVD